MVLFMFSAIKVDEVSVWILRYPFIR